MESWNAYRARLLGLFCGRKYQYRPRFHTETRRATDFDNLAQALAELRQICAEENYTIEVPPRQDRSNPFAESLNDIPVWY